MATVTQRKRKQPLLNDQRPSKFTRRAGEQETINVFGNIGKHRDGVSIKKLQQKPRNVSTCSAAPLPASCDRKRKQTSTPAIATESGIADKVERSESVLSASSTEKSTRIPSTPHLKRCHDNMDPSCIETPTKGTMALFKKMKIGLDHTAQAQAVLSVSFEGEGRQDSPGADDNGIDMDTPPELQPVRSLFASFLSAMSMHYSHNRSASPVNVQVVLDTTTDIWKKRPVRLADLQRLLDVLNRKERSFILEDFGKAGISVVRSYEHATQQSTNFINEQHLKSCFDDALLDFWQHWLDSVPKSDENFEVFLSQLPLLNIRTSETVAKTAPLFARGEQRLKAIKASQATGSQSEPAKTPIAVSVPQKSPQAVQSRGSALLDRVLAKQRVNASLPSGPTQAQLDRHAALHRIEEIARVLFLLGGSKERSTHSIHGTTQHIQQSLRNPVSSEEVVRSLELMGSEITPGFVKIVQSGAVRGVVIVRSECLSADELRERVQSAITC